MHLVKMHSLGTDYLLTKIEDGINYSNASKKILDRIFGVGAKALILVKEKPLEMKVYDSNGKLITFDSNALICFSKYVFENKIVKSHKFEVLTGKGIVELEITGEVPFTCSINLGKPLFNNKMLYITDSINSFGRELIINNTYITSYSLFIGEPHLVIFTDVINSKLHDIAKEISSYKIFNKKINVSFAYLKEKGKYMVKTYDKEDGFVHASLHGCAAVMVAAKKLGFIKNKCECILDYGNIIITADKKDNVYVSGDANDIFEIDYKYVKEE